MPAREYKIAGAMTGEAFTPIAQYECKTEATSRISTPEINNHIFSNSLIYLIKIIPSTNPKYNPLLTRVFKRGPTPLSFPPPLLQRRGGQRG